MKHLLVVRAENPVTVTARKVVERRPGGMRNLWLRFWFLIGRVCSNKPSDAYRLYSKLAQAEKHSPQDNKT